MLQLLVIASIHQPSTSTFQLFDKLLLLSSGRTCYFGPIKQIEPYFASIGHTLDVYTNPAEFLLDLVSSDFTDNPDADKNRVEQIQDAWMEKEKTTKEDYMVSGKEGQQVTDTGSRPGVGWITLSLLHRLFIKSYRDVVAYGIRIVMYMGMYCILWKLLMLIYIGLAIMMGTVWLRLDTSQKYIQPFINAIVSFHSLFIKSLLLTS